MKREKQHRRVSQHGPFDHTHESSVTRAIAVAENEGWPVAKASTEESIAAYHSLRAELALAVLRR